MTTYRKPSHSRTRVADVCDGAIIGILPKAVLDSKIVPLTLGMIVGLAREIVPLDGKTFDFGVVICTDVCTIFVVVAPIALYVIIPLPDAIDAWAGMIDLLTSTGPNREIGVATGIDIDTLAGVDANICTGSMTAFKFMLTPASSEVTLTFGWRACW